MSLELIKSCAEEEVAKAIEHARRNKLTTTHCNENGMYLISPYGERSSLPVSGHTFNDELKRLDIIAAKGHKIDFDFPYGPTLWVIGGPNGSGKSTIINGLKRTPFFPAHAYINADDIMKENNLSNLDAAILATSMREEALKERKSFAFETVMSRTDKIDFMQTAKSNGYNIVFIFVTTKNPLVNLARIKNRVALGGHDVPADKVITRYERTMRQCKDALALADSAILFDNSGTKPEIFSTKNRNGEIKLLNEQVGMLISRPYLFKEREL